MTGSVSVTPDYMRAWGRHAHASPLYRHLVEVIADDPELLRVMGRIEHRPPPNVLFAAVHHLLLTGVEDDLASYYRSLTDRPRPPEESGEAFRRFVLAHEETIVELGRTRMTQTNEVRRCAAILPMVWTAPFFRFHLVEVGASAGLNLALDRYRYRWGGLEWGPDSPLLIETESRGKPPVPKEIMVGRRIGLDLNPIDADDPEDRAWLDALIWPEHEERRHRLRLALGMMGGVEVEMVAGDALDTLPQMLAGLPAGDPAVVVNAFTLIQFTSEATERLESAIAQARRERPLLWASMEVEVGRDEWAQLVVDDGSGPTTVGQAHPHGDWIELR